MLKMLTRFTLRMTLAFVASGAGYAHGANTAESKPHVQVGILLFDGVQIIDFAAPYEVFGTAKFGVVTISRDGRPVKTAMGLTVTPDHSFANAPAVDVLMVPGGETKDASNDSETQRFVRERSAVARNVLSVCTGAYILASSGVLDGLQATTFHVALPHFEKTNPKIKVARDVRWTDNGKVITSAGLSSGIDAALHVVARLRGVDAARTTALYLEYDWKPDGGFVRTKMADRYLRGLKPNAKWPGDMRTEQLSSFGDARHWRQRFNVTTAVAPAVVLNAIGESVEAIDGFKRIGGKASYIWQQEAEGQQARVTLIAHDKTAAKDSFELELKIDVRQHPKNELRGR